MQKRLGWRFNQRHSIPDWVEHRYDGLRYARRVLVTRPQNLIGYWPMWEGNGIVSFDNSPNGYNGAYTGVTLGQPGIGDGRYSALFDGVNDFNNIYSAGLANDTLLLNGGFETPGGGGADIWANWSEAAGDGVLANEVVIVHQGVDACKMTAGPARNTYINQTMAVVPNNRTHFRFWTQGDGVNDGRYRVWDVTNGVAIIPNTHTGITGAAWEMVPVEFTVPAGCVLIYILFQCPDVNGGICYFDATEVRRTNGFLGDRGTIVVPARVFNAGVWTDGLWHYMSVFYVDVNNRCYIAKSINNNQILFVYVAGGVNKTIALNGISNLDFMWSGITWDISAGASGQTIAYYNGAQIGAIQIGLGTWVGDLLATSTLLGAFDTVPQLPWYGWLAHAPSWNVALTPAEMAFVGTPL